MNLPILEKCGKVNLFSPNQVTFNYYRLRFFTILKYAAPMKLLYNNKSIINTAKNPN